MTTDLTIQHTCIKRKRKLLLLASVLSACLGVLAQTASPTYSFIDQKYNHLSYASDSSAFLRLFLKMEELKQGKKNCINVVHMGGSHVQGGTWSNTFITDLQNEFQTQGGGYFTFPYKIAKTNSQPYSSSFSSGNWKRCRANGKEYCQPLGMNALSVSTNDSSCYFGVKLTEKASCKKANKIKVFHNFNSSFEFVQSIPDSIKLTREEFPQFGYTLFQLSEALDSILFKLTKLDTIQKNFTLYGLSCENDKDPGFYLAGLGANGASSSSFLRCSQLVPQLQTLNGDLFILSLGVNDTQSKDFQKDDFIENYDTLITFIKQTNPNAAIILTTTTDNFVKRKNSNKRTITAQQAMFELMQKHQVAVWDLFALMGGYKSMLKWQKAGLANKDRVHFTNKGYTLLGNLMYEALHKSYLNNINNNK